MFLDRLYRTSSFRLTLIFSIVFCIALSVLFYFALWSSATMVTREIDRTVASEVREVLNNAQGQDLAYLAVTVNHMSATSPRFFYLLQSVSGDRLAGNMPSMQPILGVHEWRETRLTPRGRILRVRGLGVRAIDDAYLFVGLSAHKSTESYRAMPRSFLGQLIAAFLTVVVGGLFMSDRMLRRVESISHTSRDIILGDLQRRVPVNGTNDEFDHLAVSLNTMLDRIQDLMNGLRQVSSDVAHDLRTPLTRLRQRLEHAREKASTTEEFHQALDQSIIQVDSILVIFSSLLRIAQIEAGGRRSGFKRLDLALVLRDVVDLYRPVIEENMQSLSVEISDDLMILGDGELLKLLLVNILDNAAKHAPSHCAIRVKASADDKNVYVEIADNGPGIPPDFRDKVFERFYRLEQSRSTPGYGLGLSFVAAVAALHDANVALCDTAPGLRVLVTFVRLG
jgi:signal transduction histidine kinase